MTNNWKKIQCDSASIIIILYLLICIAIVFCDCFQWEVLKGEMVVFVPAVKIGCGIILAILCLLACLLYFVFRGRRFAALPLIVAAGSLFLVVSGYTMNVYVYGKFILQHKEMERAAMDLYREGVLEDADFTIPLPEGMQTLSSSQSVRIQAEQGEIKFMFDTLVGFADSYAGFVYVPGNSGLTDGDFGFDLASPYTSCVRFSKHWYWIGST